MGVHAGRLKLAYLLFALALTCKEDVPLLMGAMGVTLALLGRRRDGLIVALVSVAYFIVVVGLLTPLWTGGQGLEKLSGGANRYAWLGHGVGGILEGVFAQPGRIFEHLTRLDRVRLPLCLLLAGGLAGLRGWRLLLSLTVSPLPHGWFVTADNDRRADGADVLDEVKRLIPQDAALSVQNNLGAHFAHRAEVSSFPRRNKHADYALLHLRYPPGPDIGLFVRHRGELLMASRSPK